MCEVEEEVRGKIFSSTVGRFVLSSIWLSILCRRLRHDDCGEDNWKIIATFSTHVWENAGHFVGAVGGHLICQKPHRSHRWSLGIMRCKSKINSRSASICGRSVAQSPQPPTRRRSLAPYHETRCDLRRWEHDESHVKYHLRPANLAAMIVRFFFCNFPRRGDNDWRQHVEPEKSRLFFSADF